MISKENKRLFIDKETVYTLSLIKEGILSPVKKLMNKQETEDVEKKGLYKGSSFPLPFIFAPDGLKNKDIIKNAKKGEILDLYLDNVKKGFIEVDEVFELDQEEKISKFFSDFGDNEQSIPYLQKRLGSFALSGNFEIEFDEIKEIKNRIENTKKELNAKNISAIMTVANPFHRAHERLLRITIEKSDLVVIFLQKHSNYKNLLPYDLRLKSLEYFIENYVHKNRVLIIPFDNTYIYADHKNAILDCLIAKNFGCNKIAFGEYHSGLGTYYDKNEIHTAIDSYNNDMQVDLVSRFVYCNVCNTLVNERTCPHGRHHHIKYNSTSLMALLRSGILPPAILMRKDISALLLSHLFPNRFKNVTQIYDDLFPGTGLIESHSDIDFYLELMKLYQTTSLT